MRIILAALACLMLVSLTAYADKEVYSPIVDKGEWEVETKGLYDLDHSKEKNAVQEYKNAIGYGVTDYWATELYGEFERQPLTSIKFTHLEWENRFQLTPQGKYWLDAGIYFAYEFPLTEKTPSKFEAKVLLEKELDLWVHTANLMLNKEIGENVQQAGMGLAWSTKYRINEHFMPGMEYWADYGELNKHLAFNDQSHQLGPAFYGHLGPHVEYDVGYLFGISAAAPKGELKWVIAYDF